MADSGTVFLPMVTSSSLDLDEVKQLWGERVLASTMIYKTESDPFFNPRGFQYNGFASDGQPYSTGRPSDTSAQASWFIEDASLTRGEAREFPSRALVLVTDVGVTILAIENDALTTWMTFYRGDYMGYTDNPSGGSEYSFTPTQVLYSCGALYVIQSPDNGAEYQGCLINVLDFGQDKINTLITLPDSVQGES